jgi:predicted HD phosphohydrolase
LDATSRLHRGRRPSVTSEYDALVGLLRANAWLRDPNPERSRVTGLEHMLQAATRAERDDASPDEIVMALIHDAARPLSDCNHGAVIAEILYGKLPTPLLSVLQHHGEFQADVLAGTRYAWGLYERAAWYPTALRLAAWDAASFQPEYPTEPLEHFLPMLAAVMER